MLDEDGNEYLKTLKKLSFLVIDEADKLLDQSFQQWLQIVMTKLPKEQSLAAMWRKNRLTKIVLSATMTRDIGQLSTLKLYRPKLVVLDGLDRPGELTERQDATASEGAYVLPDTLKEFAVKVDNESEKPMYLVHILKNVLSIETKGHGTDQSGDQGSDNTSSDEDSDDDKSSSDESSSTDTSSVASSDASPSSSSTSSHQQEKDSTDRSSNGPRGVLIFTKSNETAVRLSRLIALQEPCYAASIGTLTSTIRNTNRKTTLHAFQAGSLSILVASDLVSRGLDLPDLAHVINYDMPSSVTSYVHRVGRTARAGKEGHALTLFTFTEARWFWNEIARTDSIGRPTKIQRLSIDVSSFSDENHKSYEEALEALGKEASGPGHTCLS